MGKLENSQEHDHKELDEIYKGVITNSFSLQNVSHKQFIIPLYGGIFTQDMFQSMSSVWHGEVLIIDPTGEVLCCCRKPMNNYCCSCLSVYLFLSSAISVVFSWVEVCAASFYIFNKDTREREVVALLIFKIAIKL